MSNDLFKLNINCVVFGVDLALSRRCVLSLDKDNIVLPKFLLTTDQLDSVEQNIVTFLKNYVFVSDLELMPQLINLNAKFLQKETTTLEIVYGFIIHRNDNINNCYWIDFDPLQENELSPILFEVMQKLA